MALFEILARDTVCSERVIIDGQWVFRPVWSLKWDAPVEQIRRGRIIPSPATGSTRTTALPSSSGQDVGLSRRKQGFDSPRERQFFASTRTESSFGLFSFAPIQQPSQEPDTCLANPAGR